MPRFFNPFAARDTSLCNCLYDIFLESLKEPKKKYSWEEVFLNIIKLSKEISKHINKGDRCFLISENRPEWLITDLSIMLSGGVTVPAYTTYTERDYEYIIDNCEPSLVFVSDQTQYDKIKNSCSSWCIFTNGCNNS